MLKTLNYYGKTLQLRKKASKNVKKPSRGAAVDGVHSAARTPSPVRGRVLWGWRVAGQEHAASSRRWPAF